MHFCPGGSRIICNFLPSFTMSFKSVKRPHEVLYSIKLEMQYNFRRKTCDLVYGEIRNINALAFITFHLFSFFLSHD